MNLKNLARYRVPVFGGPEDGSQRYISDLEDFSVAALHDEAGQPVRTTDIYITRWQRTNVNSPDPGGRWVAVAYDLIAEEVDEFRRNREPENPEVTPELEALGVHYCIDGHDWSEWEPTPKGNVMRRCRKCPLSQGSVL